MARTWCSNCGKHVRYWSCSISHGVLKAHYLKQREITRRKIKQNAAALDAVKSDNECEVHYYLMPDGRCTCKPKRKSDGRE